MAAVVVVVDVDAAAVDVVVVVDSGDDDDDNDASELLDALDRPKVAAMAAAVVAGGELAPLEPVWTKSSPGWPPPIPVLALVLDNSQLVGDADATWLPLGCWPDAGLKLVLEKAAKGGVACDMTAGGGLGVAPSGGAELELDQNEAAGCWPGAWLGAKPAAARWRPVVWTGADEVMVATLGSSC